MSALEEGHTIRDEIRYVVSDGRGGTDEGSLFVDVVGTGGIAAYQLEILDADGEVTNSVDPGDTFTLIAYVEDVRSDSSDIGTAIRGVFAAFLDVDYDSSGATANGGIVHSDFYNGATSGSNESAGVLDEVGGIASLRPTGSGQIEVFRQSFTAGSSSATIVFSSNAPEDQAQQQTLSYGLDEPVRVPQIEFGSVTLTIGEGGPIATKTPTTTPTATIPPLPDGASLTTLPGGVQFYDFSVGTGGFPSQNSQINFDFVWYRPDGSLYYSREGVTFSLEDVRPEHAEVILGMQVGGVRRITVPPTAANLAAGIVPAGELVADVTLNSFDLT